MNLQKRLGAVVLSLLITLMVNGQSNIVMQSDFEANSIVYGWDFQHSCCSYSLTRSNLVRRTGNNSMRVELRRWDADVEGSKRAEIVENSNPFPPNPDQRWFAFSNFLPADFQRDSAYDLLAQWVAVASATRQTPTPPLSLQIFRGDWVLVVRYDSVDINQDRGANIRTRMINLGPWQRGVWNDWVFYYEPSDSDQGLIRVWRNNQLLLEYRGKNYYKGAFSPFFKVGIYKWAWAAGWNVPAETSVINSRVYFVDNVRVGNRNAILNDFVIPSPAPTNALPIVYGGNNQVSNATIDRATINGSASYDTDGTIVEYRWTQESGPNVAALETPNSPITRMTGLVQGMYRFRLTARDNAGGVAYGFVNVEQQGFSTANLMPIVQTGPTRIVSLPTTTSFLSASGTYDPDGSIVGYTWTQESGPAPATIVSPNSISTNISGLVRGNYYFRLTATDNRGGMATGYVQVFVDSSGTGTPVTTNQLPVPVTNSNQTITLPTNSVTLDGRASYDPDGLVTRYTWVQLTGPRSSPMSTPSAPVTSVNWMTLAGDYTFRLFITDDRGASAGSQVITIKVNPEGTPPPVDTTTPPPTGGGPISGVNLPPIASAGINQTITLPTNSVTLNGTGSYDPDGRITRYTWVQLTGPKSAPMSGPFAALNTINWMIEGTYSYQLFVTDDSAATSRSPIVFVTVLPAPVAGMNAGGAAGVDQNPDAVLAENGRFVSNGLVGVKAFPNPFQKQLQVAIGEKFKGRAVIQLLSQDGVIVHREFVEMDGRPVIKDISLGHLASGTYVLQVLSADGRTRYVNKILKQ
ncbi:heparin lyase I family protein [Flavihumibacter rivuli]|uniref:PKD domain-containing protein n=1 Tax=Flavihumibacter rivuli TaxID=2838156 RepID=UPI001BDED3C2|nr:heparin lyase I family protein [Flavihumibacter rivuli]ULQ58086.1 heparin lyase I family protein [Flavihumibacter rivuli]